MIRLLRLKPEDPLNDPVVRKAITQPRAAEVRQKFPITDAFFPQQREPEEQP